MITTIMLKRQLWMANDDEFDHIVKNSQRVLKLSNLYKNHLCVEEFTKMCNVMFVRNQFLQVNDKLYEGVELPTKNISYSTEH